MKTRSSNKDAKKIINAHFRLMKKHIHDADVYVRICQTSMMEFFLKAGERVN